MQDPQKKIAEALAKALAAAGIKSDEPAPPPVVRALSAVVKAVNDLGMLDPSEMRQMLEERKDSDIWRKVTDRKFVAFCSRALKHSNFSVSEIRGLEFAWGYFSAKVD